MSSLPATASPIPPLGIFLFLGMVAGPALWIQYAWARRRLDAWARENGVRLLRCRWRLFFRGPYGPMGKYSVFRIEASDGAGRERVGWVRLGGFWVGLWSPESQVIWEWTREAPPN
jgi:hypothetical protein